MPQEIDNDQVFRFFEERNYKVNEIRKPWRHIVGTLEKDGERFYFKMAAWPEISPKTQNEVAWNNLVNSELALPLKAPQIFDSGIWQDCFWYISEHVDGKELANIVINDTKLLEPELEPIADCMKTIISSQSTTMLPKDKENESKDIKSAFQEKLAIWKNEIKIRNIEPLWNFIQERIYSFSLAPIHGDFVPWHILKSDKGLYLIDGEHAAMKGIKFYDVAYFYQRVYTKLKRPDIANKFLNVFKDKHQFNQQDFQCFEGILAQRLMGGYLDAQTDGITNIELQDELTKKLLDATIFTNT